MVAVQKALLYRLCRYFSHEINFLQSGHAGINKRISDRFTGLLELSYLFNK